MRGKRRAVRVLRKPQVLPRREQEKPGQPLQPVTAFRDPACQLSVIVPAAERSVSLIPSLLTLQPLREEGHEVILLDRGGGDIVELVGELVDQIVEGAADGVRQFNLGARYAWGEVLLFLPVGGLLPEGADRLIFEALSGSGCDWGCFRAGSDGCHPVVWARAACLNLRTRFTAIVSGEQGIFVRRSLFEQCGGFPQTAVAEGAALSRILREHGRPVCLRSEIAVSSGRRGGRKVWWRRWPRLPVTGQSHGQLRRRTGHR